MNPFKRTINNGFGNSKLSLPRAGLLLYLGRPNLEAADVPLGDDTEIGDDTIIRWMFLLPADADIRSATGWVSGVGNIFYDAAGDPVAVLASEIAALSSINQRNVLFHLVSADTETGRLAIYAADTPDETLDRALKVLREPVPDRVYPSAFFNGMDFRLATYTGGPTYVPDHLGVLRSPGANLPAVQGMRLDGATYLNTDVSGNAILPSTPQKTVTYNTDWTAKTFAETFDKFDISDPLKAPGWLCEPVRTNKVTCRKSNPVDNANFVLSGGTTITVVTESLSNLQSVVDEYGNIIDISNICNTLKVYEATFPSGASFNIGGVTGNTNKHSMFVIYKMVSGADTVDFGLFGDRARLTTSPSYRVIKKENSTPASSSSQLVGFNTSAGTVVLRFILPQLEEGPFCTSPICKAADGSDPLTGLTRSATVSSFPTAGKIPANNFAIRMIVVPRASGQGGFLIGSYVDANNSFSISITPTAVLARKRNVSVDTEATVSLANAKGVPIDLLIVSTLTGGMHVSSRVYSGSWGTFTDGPLNSTTAAKANAQVGSTYQLGGLNSATQFTGNISLFDCVPIPSGINDQMAWAKTHWGVA